MIVLNDKKQVLTLKAIFKNDQVNNLVIKENERTTLISEDKTIYVYFEKPLTFKSVYKFITNFTKTNKYNINIDVDSFKKNAEPNSHLFKALAEGLYYSLNKNYSLKTTNKKEEKDVIYNLVHDCPNANNKFIEITTKMEYVNFARILQDTPPNLMYPEIFAKKSRRRS
ncbi:hypothetical protein P344_00895 [Spiroplasma mirum ATCC 29335]|uniref:Uncharacterized protein n=1 Tax=Spiroplasma mirum ATCC 29335 TaxID=838561 RepID=W6AK59_9MOLU|nr:hypothetical protein [Spiroplasma mirum]AHI57552.1 hypothetical protein P344_00895 [Spiroplasma mirum ATCC 29335]